ncbi:MAG: YcxB family protein [Candidatus Thiodiazotropha sp. L084R]
MEIEITYEKDDWSRFQGFLEKEIPRRTKTSWDNAFINILVWAFIGVIAMSVFRQFEKFHWPTAGYIGAIAVIIFIVFIKNLIKMKNAFAPSESGCFIGSHRFVFSATGIESNGNSYKAFHSWPAVKEIVRSDGLIMLFIDTAQAFILPEQKLDNPEGLFNYIQECKKQISADSQG